MRLVMRPVLCVCLLLCACAKNASLSPEEVLRRSALAGSQLTSAHFEGSMTIRTRTPITANLQVLFRDGTLQAGGGEAKARISLDGTLSDGATSHAVHGIAEVVSAGSETSYVRVQNFSIQPENERVSSELIRAMSNTWVRFGTNSGMRIPVTPDPAMLKAQADIIAVTAEHGLTKIAGKTAYRYDVELDPEKLGTFLRRQTGSGAAVDAGLFAFLLESKAQGELLIDAERFYIHRIHWSVPALSPTDAEFSLDVRISDHDLAEPIEIPTDAIDVRSILQGTSSASSLHSSSAPSDA